MNGQVFVKSFSHGQITIPKVFRDRLGLSEDFWLKMGLDDNRLVAEPVIDRLKAQKQVAKLLTVSGDWFDMSDWRKTRREVSQKQNVN